MLIQIVSVMHVYVPLEQVCAPCRAVVHRKGRHWEPEGRGPPRSTVHRNLAPDECLGSRLTISIQIKQVETNEQNLWKQLRISKFGKSGR